MKKIFVIIFGFINLILLGFIVWSYKELRFGSAETKLQKNKEQEIVRYERIIKSFDEKKFLSEHASYIQRIPTDMLIPLSAIKMLRQWAVELKMENVRFSYEPKEITTIQGFDKLRVVPFHIGLTGTYDAVLNLLERIPTADVLIIPVALEIKRTGTAPSVDVTMVINTYTNITK